MTHNDAGSETALTARQKVLKILESRLEENPDSGGFKIKKTELHGEAYNFDVEHPEDYIVPPMSWDGYTVISDLVDQGIIGNGRHDNRYWIYREDLEEMVQDE